MALTKDVKTKIIKEYARDEKDTGSAEVQIALLTKEIEALLNVKVINKETNELKAQLEQQLKEKLNELKGKQKKLV